MHRIPFDIYVDSRVREIVQFAYKFCEPIEPNSKLSAPQHISLIDYLAYILGFIRKPIQIHSSSTSFFTLAQLFASLGRYFTQFDLFVGIAILLETNYFHPFSICCVCR